MGNLDGSGTVATFKSPKYIRVGYSGPTAASGYQLMVVDGLDNSLRLVTVDSTGKVNVTRFAGVKSSGSSGGTLLQASFYSPGGITRLALTSSGAMTSAPFFVADTFNHSIRRVHNKYVSLLTGAGKAGMANGKLASAKFSSPIGITQFGTALYVADSINHRIRIIVLQ